MGWALYVLEMCLACVGLRICRAGLGPGWPLAHLNKGRGWAWAGRGVVPDMGLAGLGVGRARAGSGIVWSGQARLGVGWAWAGLSIGWAGHRLGWVWAGLCMLSAGYGLRWAYACLGMGWAGHFGCGLGIVRPGHCLGLS
jgi:hypothetical protein